MKSTKASRCRFGQESFSELCDCRTYELHQIARGQFDDLVDHGFVADSACCWSEELDGIELVIVARTYVADDKIDNPPEGIKIVRLPDELMGPEECGTVIAIAVVGVSPEAENILTYFLKVPATMLAFAISRELADGYGYMVALEPLISNNFPVCRLVKRADQARFPYSGVTE